MYFIGRFLFWGGSFLSQDTGEKMEKTTWQILSNNLLALAQQPGGLYFNLKLK